MDVVGTFINGRRPDPDADTPGMVGLRLGTYCSPGLSQADLGGLFTRLPGVGVLGISLSHPGAKVFIQIGYL